MLYEALTDTLDDICNRHSISSAKIDAYVEAVSDQLSINYAKAREKVMVEDGTAEDLMYLQEEADEGIVEKLKKAIEKIIEAFKKFCNEIKIKVLALISSKETEEKTAQIEKKVKLNPFLGKKKVQVEDTDKQLTVVEWANDKYRKLIAKIKSGRTVDSEDVTEIADEANSKMRKAVAITAAITVTVIGGIAIWKKRSSTADKQMKSFSDKCTEILYDAEKISDTIKGQCATVLTQISSHVSENNKKAIRSVFTGIQSCIAAIAGAVSKASGNIADKMTESSDDDAEFTGQVYESDASGMLDDIESELFGESAENSDDDDFDLDLDF